MTCNKGPWPNSNHGWCGYVASAVTIRPPECSHSANLTLYHISKVFSWIQIWWLDRPLKNNKLIAMFMKPGWDYFCLVTMLKNAYFKSDRVVPKATVPIHFRTWFNPHTFDLFKGIYAFYAINNSVPVFIESDSHSVLTTDSKIRVFWSEVKLSSQFHHCIRAIIGSLILHSVLHWYLLMRNIFGLYKPWHATYRKTNWNVADIITAVKGMSWYMIRPMMLWPPDLAVPCCWIKTTQQQNS